MSRLWIFFKAKRWTLFKILFGFFVVVTVKHLYRPENVVQAPNHPILIWWTPKFRGFPPSLQTCKNNMICEFTNDRTIKLEKDVEGFLFYGSDFDYLDLPLPRDNQRYVWGLLHEESPRNTPIIQHGPALKLFNYSSTISRHSNVPLTLLYLTGLKDLLSKDRYVPTQEKNHLLRKLSPVLYLQTDCDTSSYRDSYVKELMKYVSVDSYGKCLNNKKLPRQFSGDYLNNLHSDEFLKFVSQYKFTISFENAICDDYITEKLWRPLIVGSVPVYMGSPSVRDWLPNAQSAIISSDFDTPKHLAAYIDYLNKNDAKYEEYLQHKISNKVTNYNLVRNLEKRSWKVNGEGFESFIDTFECYICEKVHERRLNKDFKGSIADQLHYNCPIPNFSLKHKNFDRWWIDTWELHRDKANILYRLLIEQNKANLSEKDFL